MRQEELVASHVYAPGLEIRFEQSTEVIETMLGVRKPDPNWKHVDRSGHLHAWVDDKLPTLGEHVTGKTWVGDEYDGCEVDITEHRCLVCAAIVEPKYVVSHEPQYVRGPASYFLVVHPGWEPREFPIPEDDAHTLIDILQRMFPRER